MTKLTTLFFGGIVTLVAASAMAVDTRPDLQVFGAAIRRKCDPTETTCTLKNISLSVRNNGSTDAPNSVLTLWVSADATLSTATDQLVKRVALGKVKPGADNYRARTFAIGLFKHVDFHATPYLIGVADANNTVDESDESNNVFPFHF